MTDSCVFFWTLAPSECASWVQAWGTIAALAVSVGVWWWQSARARDDRVQAEIDRLTERVAPALGLLGGMLFELNHIVVLVEAQQGRVFKSSGRANFSKYQGLLDEYLRVEAHAFPDAELALKAAQAKEFGLRIRDWIGSFDSHAMGGGIVMHASHVEQLKGFRLAIAECRDEMQSRLVARANMIITPAPKKTLDSSA